MRFSIPAAGLALVLSFALQPRTLAQSDSPGSLRVAGNVATPLSLSAKDLKAMPRTTIKVLNPHENKEETYEGVAVQELLRRAGVPQNEKLRGAAMASYVLAEASDGYAVLYSLAELDAGFQNSEVIVADTMNGLPLIEKQGPFKMVAPHDKRPARWIRMLKSLTVVTVAPPKS
ncbi:MAG TPA: molybdopterin-dependent oxidoreductase [Candidatus Acidoferrum sp.]